MILPVFSPSGSLDSLSELIDSIVSKHRPEGLVVFGGTENDFNDSAMDRFLKELSLPIGGGLFPAILYDNKVHSSGWIIHAVYGDFSAVFTDNISGNKDFHYETKPVGTSMVIVDGHAQKISSFLQAVYADSSISTNFFGGGAGSLASSDRRCIVSNQGLKSDAAVVLHFGSESGIGVAHGWKPASKIFRVTAAEGNIVHELDYRPALEVYTELVKTEFSATVDPADLIGTASMFPLGIRRIGGSLIVRDPIAVTETGGLICVGEFDNDSFVYLLTSDIQTLLNASLEATQLAVNDLPAKAGFKVVFDCISRFLLMQKDFDSELTLLAQDGVPVAGVLSIGEIASNNQGCLEFYNKTTAVAAFSGD